MEDTAPLPPHPEVVPATLGCVPLVSLGPAHGLKKGSYIARPEYQKDIGPEKEGTSGMKKEE